MKTRTLIVEQEVSSPRDEVFAFFDRPENLAEITPPWLDFEILTPPPIEMRRDALIDYVVRLHRLPVLWSSLIAVYEPPDRFVDVQLRGPYSFWHHEHHFTETPRGTLIRDEVRYAMPLGLLGDLVHRVSVRRQIERIFAYRRAKAAELFGDFTDES